MFEKDENHHELQVARFAGYLRPHYDSSAPMPDISSRDDFILAALAGLTAQTDKINRTLIELNRTMEKLIDRIDAMDQRLERDQNSRLILIEERLGVSQRLNEFPPAEEITKLKAQFWVNTEKNKRIREERKANGKRGGGSLPNHQLEIHVWTCRPELHAKFPDGNCGEFYIPVYVPNTTHARERLGNDLNSLPQQNAKWIGMLAKKKVGKWSDQAGIIERDNRLRIFIRDIPFDLGLPSAAPADADPDAARLRWDWPDTRG